MNPGASTDHAVHPQGGRGSVAVIDWTPEAILEHVLTLLRERDLSYAQRLDALDRLTDAKLVTQRVMLDSQAEKVALALASADKAVTKAEQATEKRFEGVNEFRQTLSDQASTFINRREFEALREAQAQRTVELAARVDKTEGRSTGLDASWGYLVGAAGLILALVSVATLFTRAS
jgi:hypothetical protein